MADPRRKGTLIKVERVRGRERESRTPTDRETFQRLMDKEKFRRMAENAGLGGVAYYLFYRSLNHLTYFRVLQGMTLTMETVDPKYLASNPAYTDGFLDEARLREFAKDPSSHISDSFLDIALPKGDRCYAFLAGERLASFGWYSDKPTLDGDLMLHFDPAWIYMYHGYTKEEDRGQRLHAVGMAKALRAFTAMGYRGIVSYVESNNYSSLKSCYRMGYRNFGRIAVLRLFESYLIRRDRSCEAYSFDLTAPERDGSVTSAVNT